MNEQDIRNRVLNVNKFLLSKGFSWKLIDKFWNECIKESKEILNK